MKDEHNEADSWMENETLGVEMLLHYGQKCMKIPQLLVVLCTQSENHYFAQSRRT
jgi:hypothetical protein